MIKLFILTFFAFDYDADGLAEYLQEVFLEVLGSFAEAITNFMTHIWNIVIIPFVEGELIANTFWVCLLFIALISVYIIVKKTFPGA